MRVGKSVIKRGIDQAQTNQSNLRYEIGAASDRNWVVKEKKNAANHCNAKAGVEPWHNIGRERFELGCRSHTNETQIEKHDATKECGRGKYVRHSQQIMPRLHSRLKCAVIKRNEHPGWEPHRVK